MKLYTKIRKSGGSNITSIPALLLKLSPDVDLNGEIEWDIDTKEESVKIQLKLPYKKE